MKRFLHLSLALLLTACNQPPAGPTAEEIAAEQDRLERACVRRSMELIYSDPRDDLSIQRRIAAANLSDCPTDFSTVFVGLRQNFNNAIEFNQRYQAHKRQEDSAVGAGVTVTLLEWMSDSNSGVTPYTDWAEQNEQLLQEGQQISAELRASFEQLELTAAAYGTTLTTAPSSNAEPMMPPPADASAPPGSSG